MKKLISIIIAFSVIVAQYTEEWQVAQDPSEKGLIYFDLNNDDTPELTKIWMNNVVFFDGENDYQINWEIVEDNYDYLNIYELYDFNGDEIEQAVFVSTSYDPIYRTKLAVWDIFATEPVWTTGELSGEIYFIDSKDMDNDGMEELVFGLNDYNYGTSTYTSKIYIYDGASGTLEWTSELFNGYIAGPYIGNLDLDEQMELIYNLYDYENEIYTLHVLQYTGGAFISGETTPVDFQLGQNFPNPFNPSTVIPVKLSEPSHVTINIVDIKGNLICRVIDKMLPSGNHQFPWAGVGQRGNHLSSGVYFYQVKTNLGTITRPMMMMK
ncbi:MAG: T9SS type A sorting domain-containing protein [Candidatus Marinimicrobia bacterium]|nr:T9SS type A sorting domain-containing protein [Candidatus Neomarinimicrobiota bacterium]MBL7022448.1 T9SS type A sorting domain-containing protein [Candidatus Neomarinimicrobiota bacterium]MBL7108697.1 T9SS type A sorting domain-containing protein [Candidatus Neomarinimicrobiota bacterium]